MPFISGQGGVDGSEYGSGGYSWFNPHAVLHLIDRRNKIMTAPKLANTTLPAEAVMQTWKHLGQGKKKYINIRGGSKKSGLAYEPITRVVGQLE